VSFTAAAPTTSGNVLLHIKDVLNLGIGGA
jgi:hypothetical protein